MTILKTPTWSPWPMPPDPVRRFTVDEYHQLIHIGMLTEDDDVELLEGWVTQKMARNPPHDSTVNKVTRRLAHVLPADWIVRVQSAITTDDSEPEPDLAVVTGPDDRYVDHHPGPADISLVIEVSDTTLRRDRGQKQKIHARAEIACYWIINLIDRRIEVYSDPTGGGQSPQFRQHKEFARGESVPLTIRGHTIDQVAVTDLLPPP